MSKWAVIGSNSFSGAAFCRYLVAVGEVLIRIERPKYDLNKDAAGITFLLEKERPDYIVNFAALSAVAESWECPLDWFQTNVMAQIGLTDYLRRVSWLKKYVQVSTPEVYGSTGCALREGAPFNPSTPYAASRAACDLWLQTLNKGYGFPVAFTRTVNVYGPGQQLYRIIPKTVMCILSGTKLMLDGGGESSRSFIHIADVADATYRVALDGKPGMTYHISTERQIRIIDLVFRICVGMNVRFKDVVQFCPDRLGKDMNYQLDSTRIRDELDWEDKISLEVGIDETIAWVQQNYEQLKTQPQIYQHRP